MSFFQVKIQGIGDFSNVVNSVKGVQNSLNQLKLPADLKGKFNQIFSQIKTDAEQAQKYIDGGFKNKSDVTAYGKLIDNIDKSLQNLSKDFASLDPSKLAELAQVDSKPLQDATNRVKELQAELKQQINTKK